MTHHKPEHEAAWRELRDAAKAQLHRAVDALKHKPVGCTHERWAQTDRCVDLRCANFVDRTVT